MLSEIEQEIYSRIKIGREHTARELAKKCGIAYPTVLKYLNILESKGLIESITYGRTKVWKQKDYLTWEIAKKGWINVGGRRVCLFDVIDGLFSFKQLLGRQGRDVIFKVGYTVGKKIVERLLENNVLPRNEKGLRIMIDTITHAGFGEFQIESLNLDREIIINCIDSAEAWSFVKHGEYVEESICDYTRGNLLAFIEVLKFISDRDLQKNSTILSEEVNCIAKKDSLCKFVYTVRDKN